MKCVVCGNTLIIDRKKEEDRMEAVYLGCGVAENSDYLYCPMCLSEITLCYAGESCEESEGCVYCDDGGCEYNPKPCDIDEHSWRRVESYYEGAEYVCRNCCAEMYIDRHK